MEKLQASKILSYALIVVYENETSDGMAAL